MNVLGGELIDRAPLRGITIGQLADYAGVTIKAVRHYHKRGLLEEPERDTSGYRRYSVRHAIDLVKIKTLAEAGVPLARIKELLAADPEHFGAAIAEIDRRLQERAVELARTRERIAQFTAGDRLFVSADVADYLDQLRALGVSQRTIAMERDIWILMQSVSPRQAAMWIAEKLDFIRDAEFRALCLEHDAAFDWSPDDPRLPGLADRTVQWLTGRNRPGGGPAQSARDQAAGPAECKHGRLVIAGMAAASRACRPTPTRRRWAQVARSRCLMPHADSASPRPASARQTAKPSQSQMPSIGWPR
jgi:DNA-binding transcriptional MerR regulator